MDERLRDGAWMDRARRASVPPASATPTPDGLGVGIPIGADYADEATEWTPLTRRAAAGAFTPVPVSRRAGLIAGGVVLGAGGLGVAGTATIALVVGLLVGAAVATERIGQGPQLAAAPAEGEVELVDVQAQPVQVAAAKVESAPPAAAPARPAPKKTSRPTKSSSRSAKRTRRAPAPTAAPPPAAKAPVAEAPTPRPPIVAAAAAPAAAPAAAESWAGKAGALMDRMRAAGPAPTPAAAPPAPAAAPAGDLLAEGGSDDELDALLGDLEAERARPVETEWLEDDELPTAPAEQGWAASAAAAVGAGMAALGGDEPAPVAAAVPAWTAPAPTAAPAAAAPAAPAWTAPAPTPAAAPAAAPAPAAPAWTAPAPTPAAAPAPVAAPAPTAAPAWNAPAAAPAAPAPAPVGDPALTGYRDTAGGGVDLLSDAADDWSVEVAGTDPAAQFVGGADDVESLDDLDALNTMMVAVSTDKPGMQVFVDGVPQGVTPTHIDLSPGYHAVKLVNPSGGEQTFQLQAEADPDAWCFESKGRGFKLDSCR